MAESYQKRKLKRQELLANSYAEDIEETSMLTIDRLLRGLASPESGVKYPMSLPELIEVSIGIDRTEGVHHLMLYALFDLVDKKTEYGTFADQYKIVCEL